MTIEAVLSLFSSRGFLSPKAARFDFIGGDRIVFMGALPYSGNEPKKDSDSTMPRGRIAPFARRNYYRAAVLELKKILTSIGDSKGIHKKNTSIFCNSNLPEKAMAARCGVGAYGKNSLILVPETGSLCILAGFTVPSSPFLESDRLKKRYPLLMIDRETLAENDFSLCGSCEACISACPTRAISEPGSIDRAKCIQNLTTSTEIIPEEIMEKWGFTIYGCQICQEVCPKNRYTVEGFPTHEGEIGASLPLEMLLSGKPEEIRNMVEKTVMDRKWIPPDALVRNALIAAGNSRSLRFSRYIEPFLNDSRGFIRETALWAYRKTTSTVS